MNTRKVHRRPQTDIFFPKTCALFPKTFIFFSETFDFFKKPFVFLSCNILHRLRNSRVTVNTHRPRRIQDFFREVDQ